ncbi:maturation protein [ssRNA phage SRR6050738_3]|uniref:Maturation protein n=1 Tax=ssRNA phage SRR6050738_3 TaxID=2786486 RepID=A0A8S5L392_9VIRU|nr:maturation protein [ssRNA phage SRR6050738_3]DAD52246.1 TPA_asm: maturation protein [ssRNA phage SRR6050738_3]
MANFYKVNQVPSRGFEISTIRYWSLDGSPTGYADEETVSEFSAGGLVTTLLREGTSETSSSGGQRLYRVAWVPKKYPLKAPVKPELHLPKLPTLKERREGQSDSSWNKAKAKYQNLRDKLIVIRIRNNLRFRERMIKYHKRLAVYEKYVELQKTGVPRYKKLKVRYSEWHPYDIHEKSDYGFYVDTAHNPNLPGPTANIRRDWTYTTYLNAISANRAASLAGVVLPQIELSGDEQNSCAEAALSRAKRQFYQNLSKQEVHVGNIIAERHKTFAMLKDLLERVNQLLLKRNKIAASKLIGGEQKGVTGIANDLLMFQFGLRPLMSDIFSTLELLAQQSQKDTVTVRGRGKKESIAFVNGVEIRTFAQTRFVVEYEVSNEFLATLNSIGLVNPAEIAWESLPWSFVVDWFLPIGNWIHSLNNCTGLVFSRGVQSDTKLVEIPFTVLNTSTAGSDGTVNISSQFHCAERKKTRVFLTEPPSLMLPQFKNPLSVYHVLEAVALIVQRFR